MTDDPAVVRKTVSAAARRLVEAQRALEAAGLEHRAAHKELADALQARAALPGRQPWSCGTLAGYKRHRREKTQPCYACCAAVAMARRKNREAKKRAE